MLALSIYLRTTAYLSLGRQSELLSLYSPSAGNSGDRYHVPLDIFVTLGCLQIPIKDSIEYSVKKGASSATSVSSDTDVGDLIKSLVQGDLKVDTSDYMLKAEVLYFTGSFSKALKEISNGIGSDMHKTPCFKFIELIRQKYNINKSDPAKKKYLEICCFLFLVSDEANNYERAVEYITWLLRSLATTIDIAWWKIIMARCMNGLWNHKAAKTLLHQVMVLLSQELGLDAQQSIVEYALGKLSSCSNIPEKSLHTYEMLATTLLNLGSTCSKSNLFDEAQHWLALAMSLYELLSQKGVDIRMSRFYISSNLGKVYNATANHQAALQAYSKSAEILQTLYGENTNHQEIATSYTNIGNVYYELGKHDSALEYYTKSLNMGIALYSKNGNHSHIAACYGKIGNVYDVLGKYGSALDHYSRSLDMMIAIHGKNTNHPDIAECHNNLGSLYNAQGKLHDALQNFTS